MPDEELSEADRRSIELSRLIDGHLNLVRNLIPTGRQPQAGSPGGADSTTPCQVQVVDGALSPSGHTSRWLASA